ncbi:hypothetical protein RDI58_013339 [Solanum bulbocastanum]|uniref:Uncharacterized protein n=1 Tax=Solanum bulbocastanum TaxID=147425 RepID=A0AAN8TKT1_SOLBU
MSRPFTDQG